MARKDLQGSRRGWAYGSVKEFLPSAHEALSSGPSLETEINREVQRERERGVWGGEDKVLTMGMTEDGKCI